MRQNLRTAALTLGLALVATAVVAAPGSVSVSGQFLVVDGGGTLRVAGPAGFGFETTLAAGERATIDLAAAAPVSGLAAGTYHYELMSGGQRVSGKFAIGAGSGSGEEIEPPNPEAVTTHSDAVAVQDSVNDGITTLDLDSDGSTTDLHWTFVNDDGVLLLKEHDTSSNNEAGDGLINISFSRGAATTSAIGIGTPIPLHSVDVSSTIPRLNLFDQDGGSNWKLVNDGGQFSIGNNISCGFLCTTLDPIVSIEDGAPTDAFYIEASGQVGVGTNNPTGDFHLTNADGLGDTVFKFERGAASWNFGLTSTGVLTYNKAGTGGQEATFRDRLDANGATFEIQGSVKATNVAFPSSRSLKTGFEAMDTQGVLDKVAALPMTSWRFKTDPEDMVRFGPMAEDFHSLFDVGDGKTITVLDVQGVALAAIQGLNDELKAEVEAKDAEIEDLQARLAAIEEKLAALTP